PDDLHFVVGGSVHHVNDLNHKSAGVTGIRLNHGVVVVITAIAIVSGIIRVVVTRIDHLLKEIYIINDQDVDYQIGVFFLSDPAIPTRVHIALNPLKDGPDQGTLRMGQDRVVSSV